jgi:hypothetical protein
MYRYIDIGCSHDASFSLYIYEGSAILQQEALRRKAFMAEKWRRRIKGCKSTGRAAIAIWKNILNVRRM